MFSSAKFGQLENEAETQRLGEILCQCFNFPLSIWNYYQNSLGAENFRVIRQNGDLAGGLAIYFMGQWFGGRCIPSAGLAVVGTLPEYRGQGIALELLRQTLRELYLKQIPISVLYPATQRLYRRVGYEQAGTYCCWELPLASLSSTYRSLPVERLKNLQIEHFLGPYRQFAQSQTGYLERHLTLWQNILKPPVGDVYAYRIGSTSQSEGYLVVSQTQSQQHHYLEIRDWVTLSAEANRRVLSFLADHRSQVQTCRWWGGAVDPRLLLLPEQTAKVIDYQLWFLRIVDVVKALEMRPYPLGIQTELHLKIQDDVILENQGNFCLSISDGQGQMTPGGRGEFEIDIRGLAPLFTGLLTPRQLQHSGYLTGTDEALQIATSLFPSASPAMPEFF